MWSYIASPPYVVSLSCWQKDDLPDGFIKIRTIFLAVPRGSSSLCDCLSNSQYTAFQTNLLGPFQILLKPWTPVIFALDLNLTRTKLLTPFMHGKEDGPALGHSCGSDSHFLARLNLFHSCWNHLPKIQVRNSKERFCASFYQLLVLQSLLVCLQFCIAKFQRSSWLYLRFDSYGTRRWQEWVNILLSVQLMRAHVLADWVEATFSIAENLCEYWSESKCVNMAVCWSTVRVWTTAHQAASTARRRIWNDVMP
jgi:hypothetical protein